jgi:hypothetical protein
MRPFHTFMVDDQGSWTGLKTLVAAWHIARAIERSTDREAVGLLLPLLSATDLAQPFQLHRLCAALQHVKMVCEQSLLQETELFLIGMLLRTLTHRKALLQ